MATVPLKHELLTTASKHVLQDHGNANTQVPLQLLQVLTAACILVEAHSVLKEIFISKPNEHEVSRIKPITT